MVGKYLDTIESLGLTATTWFVTTSDHGDMNMEHQQVRRNTCGSHQRRHSNHFPLTMP